MRIRNEIKELCGKGDFSAAHRTIKQNAHLDFGWLSKAVKQRVGLETHIAKYVSKVESQSRIDRLSGTSGCTIVESTRLKNGLIAVACLVHDLGDRKVFEKVVASEKSHLRERHILETIGSRKLGAPEYLGYFSDGRLHSVFCTAIEATECRDRELLEGAVLEFASRMWFAEQSPSVSNSLAFNCRYAKMLKDEALLRSIEDFWKASNLRMAPVSQVVALAMDAPEKLLHGDLHSGNLIYDGSKFYLIDWDKWTSTRVGAGLRFRSADFERLDVQRRLMEKAPSMELGRHVLRNFLLYNCLRWFRRDRSESIFYARELERLTA